MIAVECYTTNVGDFQFYPVMFHTKLLSASIVRRFSEQISENRELVYHYTTGEGLKGIVQSKRLWATGAYYLNDTSEIEYGCRLVASVIEESSAKAETRFAEAVLRQSHRIVTDPGQQKIRKDILYVACFCESDNLLSQWRAYSRSGGYAVGFRVADLRNLQPEHTTVSVDKVLYAKPDQIERVRNIVSSALDTLRDEDVVRGDADDPSADDILDAASDLAQVLLSAVTSFKAPDFAEEREWRIVCQPYHLDNDEKLNLVHKIVRFRASARGLVPYIELAPYDTSMTLPIYSVRFGPAQNPDLARSATRLLLDANGFRSIKVEGSSISVVLEH